MSRKAAATPAAPLISLEQAVQLIGVILEQAQAADGDDSRRILLQAGLKIAEMALLREGLVPQGLPVSAPRKLAGSVATRKLVRQRRRLASERGRRNRGRILTVIGPDSRVSVTDG